MQTISLKNHPDWIGLVDGRENLTYAFLRARYLLRSPRFQSVVVARDSATLGDSDDRLMSQARPVKVMNEDRHIKFFMKTIIAESESYVSLKRLNEVNHRWSHTAFEHDFGEDLSQVFKALTLTFPEMDMLNLRSQDEEFRPHVDGAKSMDTSNFTLTPLPGSMRATLTIKGPGTILMQAQAEDFYQKDRDFYGMWDTRKDFAASRHEQWQAAPGDVVLLRSNDWDVDQGLLPSIHTPPPRTNIGNAEERIAGIFSRNSYIYQTPPEFAWK